ncbi:hypothetical protein [Streptomyces scabichelini]|uniref:hypothetical protein n=1 Tax=Streptomyces scabichelini TaxID=2711217 RepID=UPI0019CF8CC9
MDADLEEEPTWPSRWHRRTRIAWRQVAAQLLFVRWTRRSRPTRHGLDCSPPRVVRRIPYTWHRRRRCRTHARAQAAVPLVGDLSARTAYADTEREAKVPPTLLDDWIPAFLAQLAAPRAQFVKAASAEGALSLYLFDADRESFAAFTESASGWTVRQGGPVSLWDDIEEALTAWQHAGQPDISAVRVHITERAHTYWIGGQRITTPSGEKWIGDKPVLRWEHPIR